MRRGPKRERIGIDPRFDVAPTRVCDLGTAANCSASGTVKYVSGVTYDALGRRATTTTAAGTRSVTYDGSLGRLLQDRFDAAANPYWFLRNYDAEDELGNLTLTTDATQEADIDLDEAFSYDGSR